MAAARLAWYAVASAGGLDAAAVGRRGVRKVRHLRPDPRPLVDLRGPGAEHDEESDGDDPLAAPPPPSVVKPLRPLQKAVSKAVPAPPTNGAVRTAGATERPAASEDDGKLSVAAEFGNFKTPTISLPPSLVQACTRVLRAVNANTSLLRRDSERLAQSLVSKVTLPKHRDVVHGRVPLRFSDLMATGALENGGRVPAMPPPAGAADANGGAGSAAAHRLAGLFPETELAKLRAHLEDEDGDAEAASDLPADAPVRQYGTREAQAYLTYRVGPIYGAVNRVLQELYYRLPQFNPTSMLDFGTGPGTAIWCDISPSFNARSRSAEEDQLTLTVYVVWRLRCRAAHNVYEGTIKSFVGVDISEHMLRVASALVSGSSKCVRGCGLQMWYSRHVCTICLRGALGNAMDGTAPSALDIRFQRYLGHANKVGRWRQLVFRVHSAVTHTCILRELMRLRTLSAHARPGDRVVRAG